MCGAWLATGSASLKIAAISLSAASVRMLSSTCEGDIIEIMIMSAIQDLEITLSQTNFGLRTTAYAAGTQTPIICSAARVWGNMRIAAMNSASTAACAMRRSNCLCKAVAS
jgi:hypothetical protein